MDHLGLPIYWLPILVGETKGPAPVHTGVFDMRWFPTVFSSHGIILSVSFQFTTGGSLKNAQRCASCP